VKTILCIATLDTKGPELQYVKESIEKRGVKTLVMDIGCLGQPLATPDITAEQLAKAAGSSIEEVRAFMENGPAIDIMARGAVSVATELYRAGKFDGAISLGGTMGSAIASRVLRELPIGVPKLMLATQKLVQAGIRGYVADKDIAVMISIADIAGLNRLTRRSLRQAAGAIVGMLDSSEPDGPEKDLVFMTMCGQVTGCGLKVKDALESRGYEVVVFHTVGLGGMTMESLLEQLPVKAVVEVSLMEIPNYLFDGAASAGPHRLEAAGKRGIPQIITPGATCCMTFITYDTVPEKYLDRKIIRHSPQATPVRLLPEETARVGEYIAQKLNGSKGPVSVLVPTQGFSGYDREGAPFYDLAADRAFGDALKNALRPEIRFTEIDANLLDDTYVHAVLEEFSRLVEQPARMQT
jgi:uncharacterized protein (UPF0261 family)